MKRYIFLTLAFFALPLFLFGCGQTQKKLNLYEIEIEFDEESNTLVCEQSIEYFNNSENALQEICFFVYANAFSQGQKAVSTAYKEKAYPNGESFGKIEFDKVEVSGQIVEFSLDNPAILSVALPYELFPNESIEIGLNYTISLANINHRLGVGESAINLGNFFPIACVYVDGVGFVENSFVPNGDPFYSDTANFKVTIVCDDEFIVATSGEKLKEASSEGRKIIVCEAEKVRDFAIVLSRKFDIISQNVDGVQVNYFFYDDENAQHHLQTVIDAISTFSQLFGEYPYKQISVVKTNFCYGGMEYPNLVMISDDLSDEATFDYVIVHEIAHQWWYGMVGNDEFSHAWVDEGLTEFSCALFYENNPEYGLQYETIMDNARASYKKFVEVYSKINGSVDESMNRALNEFATEPEYVNCIYTKGMLLFDSIRQSMSDKKFLKCLRTYFEDYCFENSSAEKLIESFSHTSHINLEPFFQSWLGGKVILR